MLNDQCWMLKVLLGGLLYLLPAAALAAEGDAVVNVDAATAVPFRYKIAGHQVAEKQGDLPSYFSANAWDGKSKGEAWLEETPVEGSKAIGLANIEGQTALQMYNWKKLDVPGGRIYTIIVEYLTRGKGSGRLTFEGLNDQAFNLDNTAGQWKTIKSTFEQKDAVQITTKININSMGVDNAVYLKTVKLVDAGAIVEVPDTPSKAIAYNDPSLKYVGRWLDKGNAMESTWDGGYLKANFTGTTVRVKLLNEGNITAKIDDLPEVVFEKVSGTVKLAPQPLPAGNHTLRVYATKGGVKVAGLAVDEKAAMTPAKVLPMLIEFVGDSIIAGMGTANYTTLASDKIGAEHIRLATGAMFLADGKNKLATWMDIRTGIATQYFKTGNIYQTQEPWDFKKYTADVVVINLGQNDTGEITNEFFIESYVKMMEKIRQNYPNTNILAMRPFSGNRAAATQSAVKARNDAGDKKVYFIDTSGWVAREDTNDGVHPTKDGHQKIAGRLAPLLERVLKGQAPP
jgi:lysophospholipase L1-like esterase